MEPNKGFATDFSVTTTLSGTQLSDLFFNWICYQDWDKRDFDPDDEDDLHDAAVDFLDNMNLYGKVDLAQLIADYFSRV